LEGGFSQVHSGQAKQLSAVVVVGIAVVGVVVGIAVVDGIAVVVGLGVVGVVVGMAVVVGLWVVDGCGVVGSAVVVKGVALQIPGGA